MAGYLQWLASQIDELRQRLPERQRELRDHARRDQQHRRTPDTVAHLAIGVELFLAFDQDCGAITSEEAKALWERAWRALGEAASRQSQHQVTEDPAPRFLQLVGAALSSGRAHLVGSHSGDAPKEAEECGWRRSTGNNGYKEQGSRIGWINGQDVYLEPEASFAVAQQLAQAQGETIPIGQKTLWKRLKEAPLLASTEAGKNLARITICGQRRYVVHVHASHLFGLSPQNRGNRGNGGTPPEDPASSPSTVPLKCPPREKWGQKIGAITTATQGSDPIDPITPENATRDLFTDQDTRDEGEEIVL